MSGNIEAISGGLNPPELESYVGDIPIDGANHHGASPMQFIRLQSGKLELVEETAKYLSSFNCPIAVIGIAGMVGSGKSYLLNRFDKGGKGFQVGEGGTKGLWLKCLHNKGKQGEASMTLLLDTEGLGNRQDNSLDPALFALSVLLSSLFIYNTFGEVDERALMQLHFILSLPNCISSTEDFKKQPPPFLWLLRDNYNPVGKAYLEKQLDIKEGIEINSQTCNFITRRLTGYFRDRDCFALPPPTASSENSAGLAHLNETELDGLFREKTEELISYVQQKAQLKTTIRADSMGVRKLYKFTPAYFVTYAREHVTKLNDSTSLRKNTPRTRNNTPRKEPTPRTHLSAKESPRMKRQSSERQLQRSISLQRSVSKYQELKPPESSQKVPISAREQVIVDIPQQATNVDQVEKKSASAKGLCGGVLVNCIVYGRYALGALVFFGIVIGLIVYFTRK
eukprot:Phypoly_transcript_07714.p1 GENE.Phypoly_transcript_07714~~Phypoly_transcript_07714.p1  ORF type:complete len:453 (+),score=49.46 Phypoly_transcript_07714:233-1591(+)